MGLSELLGLARSFVRIPVQATITIIIIIIKIIIIINIYIYIYMYIYIYIYIILFMCQVVRLAYHGNLHTKKAHMQGHYGISQGRTIPLVFLEETSVALYCITEPPCTGATPSSFTREQFRLLRCTWTLGCSATFGEPGSRHLKPPTLNPNSTSLPKTYPLASFPL